jgi:hypothetical protein
MTCFLERLRLHHPFRKSDDITDVDNQQAAAVEIGSFPTRARNADLIGGELRGLRQHV